MPFFADTTITCKVVKMSLRIQCSDSVLIFLAWPLEQIDVYRDYWYQITFCYCLSTFMGHEQWSCGMWYRLVLVASPPFPFTLSHFLLLSFSFPNSSPTQAVVNTMTSYNYFSFFSIGQLPNKERGKREKLFHILHHKPNYCTDFCWQLALF